MKCKQFVIAAGLARQLFAAHTYANKEAEKIKAEAELRLQAIYSQAAAEMNALRKQVALDLGLALAEAERLDLDVTYYEQTGQAFAILHADPANEEEEGEDGSHKLH